MIEEQKVSQPRRDLAEQTVEKVMSRLVDTAKVDAVFGPQLSVGMLPSFLAQKCQWGLVLDSGVVQ